MTMKDSQTHFFAKLGRIIKPDNKRDEPVLWFREIRILRKLEPGDANEVRRVELRRGLNIVWAAPEDSEEVELYGDGLSGHASGKTLFCRILRYLLGEPNYGPEALEKAVDEKFNHELWAVAEVFVDKQLWLVARPLAGLSHRFAIKGSTIDELLTNKPTHGDFNAFLEAIEDKVCTPIAEATEGNEQFRWRFLLPWLARDQECRFSSLTEWRSSMAESDNPLTSVASQQELMKAVLGLLDAKELDLRRELNTAEATIKQSNEELPSLERTEKRDYRKLAEALKRAGMDGLTGDETLEDLGKRKTLRADGLTMAIEKSEKDAKFVAAKETWENVVSARDKAEGQVSFATQTLASTEKRLSERASRYQALRAKGIENPARLEQGLCPKSRLFAEEKGCIPKTPGASLETETNLGAILAEADDLEQLKKEQEKQLKELKEQHRTLKAKVTTTFQAYEGERRRITADTAQVRAWQRQLDSTDTLMESAEESALAAKESRDALAAALKKKEEIKGTVEALRKAHEGAEKRLSDAFADAVRAAMGGKVEPTASLGERGFTLSVKRKGELSGAALETIKVLAFDLASLVLSIEGVGHHPRFLVHDGPREADMARVIYERFFLYSQKLEHCFADTDQSGFQYIITTTTHPPKTMQEGSKWLRMSLNTMKTEERFLKADF
jgi:hypothetical protein